MGKIGLAMPDQATSRIRHGAELLKQAIANCGHQVEDKPLWTLADYRLDANLKIAIGVRGDTAFVRELEDNDVLLYHTAAPAEEGFYLATLPGSLIVVVGGGDTGVLYGCLELARIVKEQGGLPFELAYGDAPVMKLRGPVVPLQKTKVEPPRKQYEFPITPGRFPWFYDRAMWLDYLDMLLEYRCNVVYIWSGHPFSSLVKLSDYPEALEVAEDEYEQNVAMLHWLVREADRRGIWVVLKFYNIHIPLPFAEKHQLELIQTKPTPLTSDYYIQSISAFIRTFPNVGLMVCLGEALNGALYGVEWFNDTILAGVNDGLKDLNLKELPPIIVRAHAIPAEKVMEAALPNYANLFTEAKYNGESLTTYTPRGRWQRIHQHLGSLGSIHLFNVHVLANLEPFRFGAPSFIQKCVQAAQYRLGTNGIHLYPLFYWDWPYAADKTSARLRQMDRDWIWFEAWFRYAWNPDREPGMEREYWQRRLAERYGSREAAAAILEAYESSGECAPKLLRRFGITEGNRQTLSLGMTMSQLTNPERYRPYAELWDCQAPQGERLDLYVQRELRGEPHIGETPIDIADNVDVHADRAERAIARARAHVTQDRAEFERLASDIRAIALMTRAYTHKVRAAVCILKYKLLTAGNQYVEHAALLRSAAPHFEASLQQYRKLTELTQDTYLYANSLQASSRKIPFPDGERYDHWRECLPHYEAEYANFVRHVETLERGQLPRQVAFSEQTIERYRQADFVLHSTHAQTYIVTSQCQPFLGSDCLVTTVAEELDGLTGIRFDQEAASKDGVAIEIELPEPARILIGYFNSKDSQWLQVPDLEVNTHADERGGLTPVIKNGIQVFFQPNVHIHAFLYEAGRHTIELGKGSYLIAGVIRADQQLQPRDLEGASDVRLLDWLYEE